MVLAVLLGVLFGIIGALPLFGSLRLVKGIPATNTYGFLGLFLGAILISLILLVVPLIVCAKTAHDVALPMAIAEMLVFLVLVIALGVWRIRQK